MFGVLRTTLALMVMVGHLFVGKIVPGIYAVFGFYIISGYLMTLIMDKTYGHTRFGRYSFAVNRFLRLYPQYWAAAMFSILLISIVGPEAVINYNEVMFIPADSGAVLRNLFMVFLRYPWDETPRLVPPTWALTVEISFYALICFGVSKTFNRVKIWLLLSICYVVYSYVAGLSWESRYFPVAAASLPFSIGSAIYFASKSNHINKLYSKLRISSVHLVVLMFANYLIWIILYSKFNIVDESGSDVRFDVRFEAGFYINLLICTFLVYSIAIGGEILKIDKKIDELIGDFSYPIYLLHVQSGLFISFLIFGEPFHEFSIRGLIALTGSILFVVILSLIFIWVIDKPIQRIRTKIKANKALQRTLVSRATEL